MRVPVKECLLQESLETMNFLNEVVTHYPDAVSFAPGRPVEHHFNVEASLSLAAPYVDYLAQKNNQTRAQTFNALGQYGRTNGVIGDLLVTYLANDEGIHTTPDAVMVTSGCQEAMAMLLMGLFQPGRDVLLVSDPSYIGITGLAQILEIDLVPVPVDDQGLDPEKVIAAAAEVRAQGKNPKAIYDIPDYNNPLGTSMPMARRQRLLDVAEAENMLIFEDNPYGQFAFDGDPSPTLKSMDTKGVVIYMGTVSKTLYPGLRLGYLVAEQQVDQRETPTTIPTELSKVKSFVSVNTSMVLQAITGGILLDNDCSLKPLLGPKVAFYKQNRDAMDQALAESLREEGIPEDVVTWNKPGGGFFLTVRLPFDFNQAMVRECAADFGVIVCPMRMFSLRDAHRNEIRLSFSYVDPETIRRGVGGLAKYLKMKI